MRIAPFLIGLMLTVNLAFAQGDSLSASLNDNSIPPGKFLIDKILVTGNKHTKTSIILREMSVESGQEIATDSLTQILKLNWQRIYNSTLFTEVVITADTLSGQRIDLHVAVKERWYIVPEVTFELADRFFNVWWLEQNRDLRRAIIGLTLTHKNFRGNREQLSVTGQVGYRKEVGIGYYKPYLDKKQRQGVGFDLGYSENNKIFYKTDNNKLKELIIIDDRLIKQAWASVFYSYRPGFSNTHILRLTYKNNQIDDTVAKLNPDYYKDGNLKLNYLELNYRLDVNKVDNWAYPLTGTKIVANIFSDIGFRGMDFFTYGTLEAGQYTKVAPKWFTSFILRGKLSIPTNQPYVLRQALGTKYEYVRGYERYVIDGYHYGLLRGNLKYELLNINIKKFPFKFRYLPVIPLRIYPKIFADAGYVWNPTAGNSFLNNRMLYSVGAGIDIFTAYDFKIRVEYAINHLGQKGLSLHFNAE